MPSRLISSRQDIKMSAQHQVPPLCFYRDRRKDIRHWLLSCNSLREEVPSGEKLLHQNHRLSSVARWTRCLTLDKGRDQSSDSFLIAYDPFVHFLRDVLHIEGTEIESVDGTRYFLSSGIWSMNNIGCLTRNDVNSGVLRASRMPFDNFY